MKPYDEQVKLLIHCLPSVAKLSFFALKGGTALNLFIQPDLPRLSVDIDLIYLPLHDRKGSLLAIELGLLQIQEDLRKRGGDILVNPQRNNNTKTITKLAIQRDGIEIQIEANFVLRGTLYPPKKMNLSKTAELRYGLSAYNIIVADKPDLYGGKICAALDRQHPRDLFDVQRILTEGFSEEIKKGFLVHLASHNRPIHELLQPNLLDFSVLYEEEFLGMELTHISYESLTKTREDLIQTIKNSLTEQDKDFLISLKKGKIEGNYIGLPDIEKLPAIQWKLFNINKMDKSLQKKALDRLIAVLEK